jgi:hypothetical protein
MIAPLSRCSRNSINSSTGPKNAGSEDDAGDAGYKIIGRHHLIDVTDC